MLIVEALTNGDMQMGDLTTRRVRRLRGLPLIDLLLAGSRALRGHNREGMIQLSRMALMAAERLDTRKYGAPVVADCRAKCWAELGNAFRVSDDLGSASRALSQAQFWMKRGSGDVLLMARIADVTASLLSSQRRFDQATNLVWHLCALYRQIGDLHLAGRALLSVAAIYGFADMPEKGLQPLLEALELLDPKRDSSLPRIGFNNLIWLLSEIGEYRKARLLLWRVRGANLLPTDPLNRIRLRWTEGTIFRGLGELTRAEAALQDAKESFGKAGLVYQSALVSLDLALLWLEQGKRERLPSLVAEMITTFRSLRIAREALAALLLLREACAKESQASEEIAYRVRVVAAYLRELEPEPVLRKRSTVSEES